MVSMFGLVLIITLKRCDIISIMDNNKQKIWFTSDTHFGHENIIRYSDRPYRDKFEMDESLIENWNSKIQPGDLVYHLGDVFFCNEERALQIINRLNGQKFLILGNHDKTVKRSENLKAQFIQIRDYHEITINGQSSMLWH